MKKIQNVEGEILSRAGMKAIIGTGVIAPPAPPTDGVSCFKCCWIATPNICSPEVQVPPTAKCVPGAKLTPC